LSNAEWQKIEGKIFTRSAAGIKIVTLRAVVQHLPDEGG
jgi:hypothetical protein